MYLLLLLHSRISIHTLFCGGACKIELADVHEPAESHYSSSHSSFMVLSIEHMLRTACSTLELIYTVCHVLYQAVLELPSIPIVFIALAIKFELFMLLLT